MRSLGQRRGQGGAQLLHAADHVVHVDVVGVHVDVGQPLGQQDLGGGAVVHPALEHRLVAHGDAPLAQSVEGLLGEGGDLARVVEVRRHRALRRRHEDRRALVIPAPPRNLLDGRRTPGTRLLAPTIVERDSCSSPG